MAKTSKSEENSSVVELKPRRGPPWKHKELLARINEQQTVITAQRGRIEDYSKKLAEADRALAQAQAANTLLRNEIQAENSALIQEIRYLSESLARAKIKHAAAKAKWRKRK